jgi:hypothetical protein
MRYEQMNQGSSFPYPNHNVSPQKKDATWCMQYARAAYYDWSFVYPKGVFSNNGGDYEKFRMYAMGKQPITQYKKYLKVDEQTNNTWLSVDWSVRAVVSGYRDKAISRMMKEDYGIVATPVDMLAKTEVTEYYAQMKAKLAVRQLMLQSNPEIASHPMISLQSGEPLDIEELEMRVELGEQFNRSKDAEMAIELGLYENNYKTFRKAIYEDLFDYGVAGKKDWLGDDNKPKFRRVNPENVVISFSKDANFRDIVHAGEVIDVPLTELATLTDKEGNLLFDEKQLQEFAGSIAGEKFRNPKVIGTNYIDKFKCQVLDIEFFTYNEQTYTERKDSNGNLVFRQEESGRGDKGNPRYKRKKIQYVYKCKWIIGTDKCYDWGMCYDQKRSPDVKKKAKTKLSYSFAAYNFYEMKAQGFMERLIPFLDDYQLTMLKIQNFKNRAVPSGWWMSLDALENVALNKGGANMQPKELLQMFFETGVLVGRTLDAQGQQMFQNSPPIIPIENTAASELAMFYQDLLNTVMTIEKMTGYNDVTMGNPNPKTLVPGYEMAQQSTQDALYPMAFAEECLSTELAEDVLCRMQQGIKKGGISGYAPALNSNSLRFIQISPEISSREYGIVLEKRTSDDQKMWLLQQMQGDIANGFLDTSDAVMIINTHNAKQAQMIWAYRVKKAKERKHQESMQLVQQQTEGNMQVAMAGEQAKQQTLQMEGQLELQKIQIAGQVELQKKQMEIESNERIAMMKLQMEYGMNAEANAAKVKVADITGQAKIIAQQMDNDGDAVKTDLAGIHAKEKQEIANKKPQSKSTK